MQSFDDRPRSMFSPVSSQETGQVISSTKPLTQDDSLPPLQVASDPTNLPIQSPLFSPLVTNKLTSPLPANATRVLTGTLDGTGDATAQRAPIIIRGNLKKPVSASRPPHPGRRKITTLFGIIVLFLVVSISLLTATPLSHAVGLNLTTSSSNNNMAIVSNRNGNNTINSIVAQATATAVFTKQQTDGQGVSMGSGTVGGGAGGSGIVESRNSSLPWPYGQCTYWANYEYHALAGWYVPWGGNADQWVAGAGAAGWNVSTYPHVPSIIVLMPGVQGASYAYGHVAVATSIIDSTTVMTSNMNWYARGGGFGIVSNVEFNYGPGYGVYFVWHS